MRDWNDLRFFLAVARAGTLTRAGRTLGVDQSTVGRRLSALESQLSARLFDRASTGWALTEAGRGLLENAEAVEARVELAERSVTGERARLQGHVRLSCTEPFLVHTLSHDLPAFTQRFPQISLEVITRYETVNLLRREAEVAIRLTRPKEKSLMARRAGEILLAPYASKDYLRGRPAPSGDQRFAGHSWIGYSKDARSWPEARWVEEHAAGARVALSFNSILGIEAAVSRGLGIGLLPTSIGDGQPLLARIEPPLEALRREIWLVVPADLQKVARVRAVLDFLYEHIQGEGMRFRGAAAG